MTLTISRFSVFTSSKIFSPSDFNKNLPANKDKKNSTLEIAKVLHYRLTSDGGLTDLSDQGNDGTAQNGATSDGFEINFSSADPYKIVKPVKLESVSSMYGQAPADLDAYDLGTGDFHVSADTKFNSFPAVAGSGDDIYRIVGEGRGISGTGPRLHGWSLTYNHTQNLLFFSRYDGTQYLPSVSFTAAVGVKYQFTVEKVGSNIEFYVNNNSLGSVATTAPSYNRTEANGVYFGSYEYKAPVQTSYIDAEINNVYITASSGHVVERWNKGTTKPIWKMSSAFVSTLRGAWSASDSLSADLAREDLSDFHNNITWFNSPTYASDDNYELDQFIKPNDVNITTLDQNYDDSVLKNLFIDAGSTPVSGDLDPVQEHHSQNLGSSLKKDSGGPINSGFLQAFLENGLSVIGFDGINSLYTMTKPVSWATPMQYQHGMVLKTNNAGARQFPYHVANSGGGPTPLGCFAYDINNGSNNLQLDIFEGGNWDDIPAYSPLDTNFHVESFRVVGDKVHIYHDGKYVSTTTLDSAGIEMNIGRPQSMGDNSQSPGLNLDGFLPEMYSLSADGPNAYRFGLDKYMYEKWTGVALP